MAVRGDAVGDALIRTTSAPSSSTFSALCWVYLAVDRNAQGLFFAIADAPATNYLLAQVGASGTLITLSTPVSSVTGSDLTVGVWTHIAVTASGTTKRLYVNGVLNITNSDAAVMTSGSQFFLIGNSSSSWTNARVEDAILYDGSALSAAEITAQMAQMAPIISTNLWGYYPLTVHTDVTDASGNGRNLTAAGTLATESGPTYSGGGVTVDLSGSPNSLALTTVDPTVVLGSLTLTLTASPNAVALTTVDPTVLNPVTLDLSAAPNVLTLTTVGPTVTAGGDVTVDLAAQPAAVALTTLDPTVVLSSTTADLAASPNSLALTTVNPTVTVADAFALPLSTVTTLARPSAVSAPRRPVGATTQPSTPGAATTLV